MGIKKNIGIIICTCILVAQSTSAFSQLKQVSSNEFKGNINYLVLDKSGDYQVIFQNDKNETGFINHKDEISFSDSNQYFISANDNFFTTVETVNGHQVLHQYSNPRNSSSEISRINLPDNCFNIWCLDDKKEYAFYSDEYEGYGTFYSIGQIFKGKVKDIVSYTPYQNGFDHGVQSYENNKAVFAFNPEYNKDNIKIVVFDLLTKTRLAEREYPSTELIYKAQLVNGQVMIALYSMETAKSRIILLDYRLNTVWETSVNGQIWESEFLDQESAFYIRTFRGTIIKLSSKTGEIVKEYNISELYPIKNDDSHEVLTDVLGFKTIFNGEYISLLIGDVNYTTNLISNTHLILLNDKETNSIPLASPTIGVKTFTEGNSLYIVNDNKITIYEKAK